MRPLILNFSGVYREQKFYSGKNFSWMDFDEIRGTDCYLDSEAQVQIQNKLISEPICNLHFIDSGNYHYMSKLWTDRLNQKFNLLVFDHHSDMQAPAFEGILSCGGWIKAVLDENPFIQKAILFGVQDAHVKEIEEKYRSKILVYSESECKNLSDYQVLSDFPVYISIDKDGLSEEYAKTNWDAGSLTLDQVISISKRYAESAKVLGMDVCGESFMDAPNFGEAQETNSESNSKIWEFAEGIF